MKRLLHPAAIPACLALCAPSAFASSDNFLEIQVTTSRLSEIARSRFIGATRTFCPTEITCPNDGDDCWVDHLEIGPPGSFSRGTAASQVPINSFTNISATPVFYTQQVTVHVKTDDCVNTVGCTATTPFNVQVRFAIEASPDGQLCTRADDVSPSIAGLPIPPIGFCFGLIGDRLSDFTGDENSSVSGAALSMNAAGTRVGLRLEVDRTQADYDAQRINAWNSFLMSGPAGQETADWSLFVHRSVFESSLRRQVSEGVGGEPAVSLAGGITTSWTGHGAAGAIMSASVPAVVSADALYNACPNDIEVGVGFHVDIHENPAGNGIESRATLSMSANNADANECAAHYGPLGFMAIPLIEIGVLDALLQEYLLPEVTKTLSDCTASDNTFTCDMQTHPNYTKVGLGISVVSQLDTVKGSNDGLTLLGPMSPPPVHEYNADAIVSDVKIILGAGCNTSSCTQLGGVQVYGNAGFCEMTQGLDPLNVYLVGQPSSPGLLPNEYEVTINPNLSESQQAAYDNAPYDQTLRIATSEGVHTYAVGFEGFAASQGNLSCTTQKIEQTIQCLKYRVFPFRTPPEIWEGIWLPGPEHVLAEIIDPRSSHIDMGLATDVRLDVLRNRYGGVVSAALVANIVSGIGTTSMRTVPFSVPINVPYDQIYISDQQILEQHLSQALTRQPVPAPYLPGHIASADMEIIGTEAELRAAAMMALP